MVVNLLEGVWISEPKAEDAVEILPDWQRRNRG